MIAGENPDRGDDIVGIERMAATEDIVEFGEDFFRQANVDRIAREGDRVPPGMNPDSQALFDEFQMGVVLSEEKLDRGRVFKIYPAGWRFFGFFFQIGLIPSLPGKML